MEAAYTLLMRIVGTKNRSEVELDPVKALRRGKILDAMLNSAAAPRERRVTRGTHAYFNRLDDQRRLQAARMLNPA